jgi:hypothetical protein
MAVLAAFVLAACGDDGTQKNYIEIAGGGLTFNYRYSQATMVVVVKQKQPLPEGSIVEAQFDLPGKTEREKTTRPAMAGKLVYKLESGYLSGIKKGEPLRVTVNLVSDKGVVLDTVETKYTSDVDQSTLPTEPPVDPSKPNYVPQPQKPDNANG